MVCQLFPHASASTLLVLFFRTYAGWAWPKPVMLNRIQPNPADASYAEQREVWSAAERWYVFCSMFFLSFLV
jgi:poly(A) polymerase Pap1